MKYQYEPSKKYDKLFEEPFSVIVVFYQYMLCVCVYVPMQLYHSLDMVK